MSEQECSRKFAEIAKGYIRSIWPVIEKVIAEKEEVYMVVHETSGIVGNMQKNELMGVLTSFDEAWSKMCEIKAEIEKKEWTPGVTCEHRLDKEKWQYEYTVTNPDFLGTCCSWDNIYKIYKVNSVNCIELVLRIFN